MTKKIIFEIFLIILAIIYAAYFLSKMPKWESSQLENNNKGNKIFYVSSDNGLRLRSEANINSKIIKLLPYNTPVKLIYAFTDKEVINGKEGYWYIVSYRGMQGYVFSAFLSKSNLVKTYNKLKTMYFTLDYDDSCAEEENFCFLTVSNNAETEKKSFGHVDRPKWISNHNIQYEIEENDRHYQYSSIEVLDVKTWKIQETFHSIFNDDPDVTDQAEYEICIYNKCILASMNYSKHELNIFKLSDYDEEKYEFKNKTLQQKVVDKNLNDYPFPCSFDIQKAIIERNTITMNCENNSFKIKLD